MLGLIFKRICSNDFLENLIGKLVEAGKSKNVCVVPALSPIVLLVISQFEDTALVLDNSVDFCILLEL